MYIKKDKKSVIVIGGSNIDIKGRPFRNLIPYTSNPGTVEVTVGGVSRNIAENLARLEVDTILLTAIGNDEYGKIIEKWTKDTGVNMDHIIRSKAHPTGRFLALLNNKKDLKAAITDMQIHEMISPEYIKSKEKLFENAAIVVIDVDIPHETILTVVELCEKHSIPLCVEPVSVTKTDHIKDILDKIAIITPNREEAEVLVEGPIEDMDGVKEAGRKLLEKGIKMAVITLGPEGVYIATKEEKQFIPSVATVVLDAIGAGDALVGGMIYGLIEGQSPGFAVASGVAAATITLKSKKAVSESLTPENLKQIYSERVTKKMQ